MRRLTCLLALAVAACGPTGAPPPTRTTGVAAPPPATPRHALALATAPAPAYAIGDTIKPSYALLPLPAGTTSALKSIGGGYLVARPGVVGYVTRVRVNGRIVHADTVRAVVGATVPPPVVTTVQVTTEVPSMAVPTTQAASARVSRGGAVDSLAVVRWAFAPATVCGAQGDGTPASRLRALAAGSCTVTATDSASGARGTATVAVTAAAPLPVPPLDTTPAPGVPPPADGTVAVAALPRVVYAPRIAETPSPGRTLRVGADLQAALDSAQAGDRVVLPAVQTWTGTYVVRIAARPDAWVTLTTDAVLPPEGTRIDPLAALPTIVQGTADPALTFAQGSRYVRLVGIKVACRAAYFSACVSGGEPRAAVDAQPSHVVLDRSVVQGSDTSNFTRCVGLHGRYIAVVDSRLLGCHGKGRDSQAFWTNYGPGPVALLNNTLEGAGENVMVGGDDPASPAHVPSDITIVGNEITTPEAWRGVWTKKNVLELKLGHRVRIEGNVLEGSWADGQIGFCAVLKSNNQGGSAPWGFTSDVVFRANSMARCELGFQLTGKDVGLLDSVTARILIQQNTYAPTPGAGQRWLQIGQGIRALTLDHNTSLSAASPGIIFAESVQPGFTFTANDLAGTGPYHWAVTSADNHGVGDAALAYHAPGGVVRGNRIPPDALVASIPSGNGAPAPDVGADTARVAAIADSVRRGVRVP